MELTLSQLWTAAAVLAGFQVSAFIWRINREVAVEAKGWPTWLTLSDGIVAVSFLVLVIGVFWVPLLGSVSTETAAKLLGVAVIVFATYPFVLAGHYNLYCRWDKYCPSGDLKRRDRVTKQEWAAAGVVTVPAILGIVGIWI